MEIEDTDSLDRWLDQKVRWVLTEPSRGDLRLDDNAGAGEDHGQASHLDPVGHGRNFDFDWNRRSDRPPQRQRLPAAGKESTRIDLAARRHDRCRVCGWNDTDADDELCAELAYGVHWDRIHEGTVYKQSALVRERREQPRNRKARPH